MTSEIHIKSVFFGLVMLAVFLEVIGDVLCQELPIKVGSV